MYLPVFRNCASFICSIISQSKHRALWQTWETPLSFSRQLLLYFRGRCWSGSCAKVYCNFSRADISSLSTTFSFFLIDYTAADISVLIKFILHPLFFHLFSKHPIIRGYVWMSHQPKSFLLTLVLSQWNPFFLFFLIENSFQDSKGHFFCTATTHNALTF